MSAEFDSYAQFIEALQSSLAELKELFGKRWSPFQNWLRQAQSLIAAHAETDQLDRHIERLLDIVIGTAAVALVRRFATDAGLQQRKHRLGSGRGRSVGGSAELADTDFGGGQSRINPIKAKRAASAAFHFLLRGEHARGSAILVGSEADLIFNYDVPPEDALSISSEKLDEARVANVNIGLQIIAGGGVTVKGERYGLAKFKEGRMVEPVPFRLVAIGPGGAKSFVQVTFTVQGETVHQTELEFKVVGSTEELKKVPQWLRWAGTVPKVLLDEALSTSKPANQRIELSLSYAGNLFCIDLQDFRDGERWYKERFVSKDIDKIKLEVFRNKVRVELAPSYDSRVFWNEFDGDVSTSARLGGEKVLKRTVETVACAGFALYDELAKDETIGTALQYIETKANNGATITIDTEDIFLPWEIMYPSLRNKNMTEKEESESPLKPELFWGVRFAIETERRGGQPDTYVGALRRLHKQADSKLSINLNPTIKFDARQRDWAKRLSAKGLVQGGIHDSCQTIRSVLQDAADEAKIIYVYCHGAASDPLAGRFDVLQLDNKCELEPENIREKPSYKKAPIVILNACQVGAISPIASSNFLRNFRLKGALGLISTTASIPILFGARFGEELVQCCLERKGGLADALLELRKEHLLKRGNPVPLLYTVLCQI